MIKLDDITKYYLYKGKKHYIFKNLTAELPSKKNIAILGKNGAGKSTLLRILGGIEQPNSGQVLTDGSISWPVGVSGGFSKNLTAKEQVQFVCKIYARTREETRKILQFVYDFAEIGDYFYRPVSTYSSGMKGRVNFGLSFAFDFDYYLIDEVTGVGDKHFRAKSKLLFDEKREKSSIIMVSHNMNYLKKVCDIGLFIADNTVIVCDSVEEAVNLYEEHV